jgi:GTPase
MTAMFVDRAKIHCVAGRGGDGMLSFRREKYVEMGGPDGGSGGDGGSVWLEADPQKATLHDVAYRPHFKAESGSSGGTSHKTGATGEDLVIRLPPGTLVFKEGRLLGDLKNPGDRLRAARGGRGGRGNATFKTSINTAPYISEKGEIGEDAELSLELKLLADVGLVGFPNAGKSTFLARVTKARPKIADYPFTTLTPNLGVCAADGASFVIADIPGLIEGAHAGKGLGDEFLRHVERTRVLVHLVDASGFDGVSPHETFKALNKELKLYSPALMEKPQIVVATKQDVTGAKAAFKDLQKKLKKTKIYPVSAVSGEGVEAVLRAMAKALAQAPEAPLFLPEKAEYVIAPDFTVEETGAGNFRVSGRKVETLAARTHFNQDEAVARLEKILRKMGVEKELQRRGARAGDRVALGNFDFTFRPETR